MIIAQKGFEAQDPRTRAEKAMRIPAHSGFSFDLVPEIDWLNNFVLTSKAVNTRQKNRILDAVDPKEFEDCLIDTERLVNAFVDLLEGGVYKPLLSQL